MDTTPIAVFDLDGTLLSGDSTAGWLRMLLLNSRVRLSLAVLVAPVCVPLIWLPATRRIGASILLWIATVGYDQNTLVQSIETFVQRFEQGELSLRWRKEGLEAMERHLAAGERVLVVTAAPLWLAERLLGSRSRVLGSTLVRRWGGWVLGHHCYGKEKCRTLERNGYGTAWDYAYTDSYDDVPLLAAASKNGFIVNARPRVLARLTARGHSRVSHVRWT